MLGTAGVAVLVLALLLGDALRVRGFYLDEWTYVHGADYLFTNFPRGLDGSIPFWYRGPQTLYSLLLAPPWGLLSTTQAFAISHAINVVLLASAVVPALLLARRLIDGAVLRTLAVAGTVIGPVLLIGAHLLTENLALPLYLWALVAIVRAAERPGPRPQLVALAVIALLSMCRLNLAAVLALLVLVVLEADGRAHGVRSALTGLPRRRVPLVGAGVVAFAGLVALTLTGGGALGAYGGGFSNTDFLRERIFGESGMVVRDAALVYARNVAVGALVLPFALGLAGGLGAIRGRLGEQARSPALAILGGFVVVVGIVALWTGGASLEERYVAFAGAPLAILAVAAVQGLSRLAVDLALGAAITAAVVAWGAPVLGADAAYFFAAPGGASWTRVVDPRLVQLGQPLGLRPSALVGVGLLGVVLVGSVLARARPRTAGAVVLAALAACLIGQGAGAVYAIDRHLDGTDEAPGGLASSDGPLEDRRWIDERVGDDARVGIVAAPSGRGSPYGNPELHQLFNRSLDVVVDIHTPEAPVTAPPGYDVVRTALGEGDVALWLGSLQVRWLVAEVDDPRVQFAGRLVARDRGSGYGLFATGAQNEARYTGLGIDADGAVLDGRPARLLVTRNGTDPPRRVRVRLQGLLDAPAPVRWTLRREGGRALSGTLSPGAARTVEVPVPACGADPCGRMGWTLTTSGSAVPQPLPAYGPPGPMRPVALYVQGVQLVR